MHPSTANHPYWSVMIPSYNRAMVRETLASVLAQDPGPERMQIQVIDNASPEIDIRSIVEELGKGRVEFHRHPASIPIADNWNSCIQRARGQWVHLLHDDDLVYPGFYEALEPAGAAASPAQEIGAAFCRVARIDAESKQIGLLPEERPAAGIFPGFDSRSYNGNAIMCPAIVVKKSVYDHLGGFDGALDTCFDWEMWVRLAQKYAVWYEPRVLAGYRHHGGTGSTALFRKGADIAGIKQAIDRFQTFLPKTVKVRRELFRVREHMANVGLVNVRNSLAQGDLFAGLSQFREALRCGSGLSAMRSLETDGILRQWDEFQKKAFDVLRIYVANVADTAAAIEVRRLRHALSKQILEFDPDSMSIIWEDIGKLITQLIVSTLQDDGWYEDEKAFFQPVLRSMHESTDYQGPWAQQLIVSMLYCQPQEISIPAAQIPEWMLGAYLSAMFRTPRIWRDASSPAATRSALQRLDLEIRQLAAGGATIWVEAKQILAEHMPPIGR